MLDFLHKASAAEAGCFFLLANIFIFTSSVIGCWGLGWLFKGKRLFSDWEPVRTSDVLAAVLAILLNATVSMLGWWLWVGGHLTLHPTTALRAVMDCVLMVLGMDFGMYVFHRLVHMRPFYQWFHGFHHRHETTNPISLFVLHPVEVMGFGSLMIFFLLIYPMSAGGLVGYLTLNVIFGTLGHSGVEPLPRVFHQVPVLGLIGTSTFHAEHHEHPGYNFGFYTLIWDKLFGTLDPDYDQRFRKAGDELNT